MTGTISSDTPPSDWAPTPAGTAANGLPALRLLAWGIVLTFFDFHISGIQLLPDIVGLIMAFVAARRLMPLASEFGIAAVAAGVGVALIGVEFLEGGLADFDLTAWPGEIGATVAFAGMAAVFIQIVFLVSALSGVVSLATAQGRTGVARRARIARIAAATGAALGTFSALVARDNDDVVLTSIFVGWLLVMGFTLFTLFPASRRLAPAPVAGNSVSSFGWSIALLAAAAVVLGGMAEAADLPPVEDPQTADPFWDEPLSPVDAAMVDQPAGLVTAPDDAVYNANYECEVGPEFDRPPGELVAYDTRSREVLWTTPGPTPDQPPVALGPDTVALIDQRVGDSLPSVTAISTADGTVKWQYFVVADEIVPIDAGSGGVTVLANTFNRNPYIVTIDADGQAVEQPSDDIEQPDPGLTSPPPNWTDADTGVDRAGPNRAVVSWSGESGEHLHFTVDGREVHGAGLPIDQTFLRVGTDTSPGRAIQVGQSHATVVLGSDDGPNTRLAVFGLGTGQVAWTRDHLRSAAITSVPNSSRSTNTISPDRLGPERVDLVIYDKRNERPETASITRDLFVVEADDPDAERWTTALDVNSDGGNGFLGSVDDGLVFAVETAEHDLDFLIIGNGDEPPTTIAAADGLGGGWSTRHLIDDDRLIAASGSNIVELDRTTGVRSEVDLQDPVAYLVPVGEVLMAATDTCNAGG